MTIAEALEKISRAIGVLTYQIQAENLAGQFSKNRVLEDLLLPVFRIVFSAPHLRNANQEAANFPYIDLADDSSRFAMQVTTERTAAKIGETLGKFLEHGYEKKYERLVVFVLANERPKYTGPTKSEWKKTTAGKLDFDPARDVVSTLELYNLIQGLSHSAIFEIERIVARSIVGEEFIDVQDYLKGQAERQLEVEVRSGKYIPDVFVETRSTKDLARNFSHPTLFFKRTLESLGRIDIPHVNRVASDAGVPGIPLLNLGGYSSVATIDDAKVAAAHVIEAVTQAREAVKRYTREDKAEHERVVPASNRAHIYQEMKYKLEMMTYGLRYGTEQYLEELVATRARVLLLTDRAGQGKTNFVCDFIENFLWKHNIPCAYLTGRRISAVQGVDLGDVVQRLIFEGKTTSFAHAAELLSEHAKRSGKPFVLVIDGLNEHHRIAEFSSQLEHFIETFLRYPQLRMLLTCRSEFFDSRFGHIFKGVIAEHTLLVSGKPWKREKDSDELIGRYFDFFGVDVRRVGYRAIQEVRKNVLMLRFFCEAYGRRGKPEAYRQPLVRHLYREEIFRIYIAEKLSSAGIFLQRTSGKLYPTDPKADLKKVLQVIAKQMLDTWSFADVPLSVIPNDLRDALYALLDEDLILRRDIPAPESVFSVDTENINFTFDEFRDYLLAEYLLHGVYRTDASSFERYIAQADPQPHQSAEGIRRFLFYASRRPENEEFWKKYRTQPWYTGLYDEEIFNIDARFLRSEDRERALEAFAQNDGRARSFSRKLAIRWQPEYAPLDLSLLIFFVTSSADDQQYDNLIIQALGTRSYNERNSLNDSFLEFFRKNVIPKFGANQVLFKPLLQLAVLLLPVGSDVYLNSPAGAALREFLRVHPEHATAALSDSIGWAPSLHLPHVWRLLAVVAGGLDSDHPVLAIAREQKQTSQGVLLREVTRFLDHVSPQQARD
jgi:hypothetical protein